MAGDEVFDEEDWLKAQEAYDLLATRNSDAEPGITIARRANAGMLKTRAGLFIFEQARPRGGKEQIRSVNTDLPATFWWAKGEAALTQNWSAGDFSTWIDQKFEWQAFGVSFERNGIEAMLAPRAAVTAASTAADSASAQDLQSVLPPDEAIIAMMIELTGRGWTRDAAAKKIAEEPGFELVQVEHARRVASGNLRRGRPKKSAS